MRKLMLFSIYCTCKDHVWFYIDTEDKKAVHFYINRFMERLNFSFMW